MLNPTDQTLWYPKNGKPKQLESDIAVDIAIVGGGMAGLSTAQGFAGTGLKVVVLEKAFCGAGASGKSSGFITPDSEFSLFDFVKKYGKRDAQRLWQLGLRGVHTIEKNIHEHSLTCSYVKQDTLVVASKDKDFSEDIKNEYHIRNELGYESRLFNKQDLEQVLGSTTYFGGISYKGSFAINGYQYCQEMKKVLEAQDIAIYEETPALHIEPQVITTPFAQIRAQTIVVCVDQFLPDLNILPQDIYHAQTFLLVSSPLNDDQIKEIYPRDHYMVWDTEQIYNYFRLTQDKRLLVGGSSVRYTYASQASYHNERMIKKLSGYIHDKFPGLEVHFEYIWPGLIGITKDIVPMAGPVPGMPQVYVISGAAGLPWACALGLASADYIIKGESDILHFFSPDRTYPFSKTFERIFGKKITFALSNFKTLSSI